MLEALAVEYGLLTSNPEGEGEQKETKATWAAWAIQSGLPTFPDFSRLRIRHPESDLKTWHGRNVDLSAVLVSGDCSKDVPLSWGEVIEIPEADHPLNERWQGFADNELTHLMKCLTRQVEVVIKGHPTKIQMGPKIVFADPISGVALDTPNIISRQPLWLKPALKESNLLLASSDLSRIKVTRQGSADGQKREWVLDCSDGKPAPAFWLRDGDVIEVPEKP